jgi:hypothetical protein
VNESFVGMLRICVLSPNDPARPCVRWHLPACTMPLCRFDTRRYGSQPLHAVVRLASC